jgi:putative MATE family efflux protein
MPEPALLRSSSERRNQVLTLAVPAMGEMVLHMFIWIVDTAMVGRLGAAALSAVGLGGHVYFTLSFVFGAVGVGVTALVSRCKGTGDLAAAARIARQGLLVAMGLGLVLGGIVFAAAPTLFRDLARLGPETTRLGVEYLRILCMGAPLLLAGFAANAAVRATGNTRVPLLAAIVGNVVNGVGDYLLIFGVLGFPRLGVEGAAIAAVLGQAAGSIVSLSYLFSSRSGLAGSGGWAPDPAVLGRLARLSVPAAGEALFLDGGRIVVQFAVASLGTVAFAAHQVTVAAESLSFMPGHGFAIAAAVLAGQGLGAGRPDDVRGWTAEAARLAGMVMGGMGLVFLAAAPLILRAFTPDPVVVALGAVCLRIAAPGQLAIAYAETHSGALRGAGDTRAVMAVTAAGIWALRVPLSYAAVFLFGLDLRAIWVIMVVEWAIRAALIRTVFRRGRWATIKL